MKKVITTFVTIFLTMAATPHWANAAIITFDEVNIDPFARTYSENGILATGSDGISPTSGALGRYGYQSVHLDDGGTDAPGKVTFTTGSYFDAVGFDLDPVEFSKGLCDRTIEEFPQIICIESFDNVLVKGFDGANLVASFLFNMGLGTDPYPVALDDTFRNLTAFSIQVITAYSPPYHFCRSQAPCSHFNIDNVELVSSNLPAAVPVPATLPLGALGLFGLAALALKRRRFTLRY